MTLELWLRGRWLSSLSPASLARNPGQGRDVLLTSGCWGLWFGPGCELGVTASSPTHPAPLAPVHGKGPGRDSSHPGKAAPIPNSQACFPATKSPYHLCPPRGRRLKKARGEVPRMKWCPRMRWCWYWHGMWLWFWSAVGSEELSQGQRGSCGVRVGQDRVNWAHAAAAAALRPVLWCHPP